jgi:hypothetical protein
MAASSGNRGLADGSANLTAKTSPCQSGEVKFAGFADRSRHKISSATSFSPGESAASIDSSVIYKTFQVSDCTLFTVDTQSTASDERPG